MAKKQIPTLAIAALAAATMVAAQAECAPEPPTRHFGPFGVARGQVARIHFANGGTIQPCIAETRVLDADGLLVARARHTLAAGAAAFLDVDGQPPPDPEAGAPPRWSRRTLRALVSVTPPPDPDAPAPTCVATLEIFDARTGRTYVLLGGPDTIPGEGRR